MIASPLSRFTFHLNREEEVSVVINSPGLKSLPNLRFFVNFRSPISNFFYTIDSRLNEKRFSQVHDSISYSIKRGSSSKKEIETAKLKSKNKFSQLISDNF